MSGEVATAPTAYVDDEGRRFDYIHVVHPNSRGLGIHLSAFFGKWGDAKPYRDTFGGYFHRMKMLGSCRDHDWLFVCDPYGAFRNGTYYTGEHGDMFVERATLAIIDQVMAAGNYRADEVVTVGSSMGGTGAIKFALLRDLRGIVAVCPHIDLDISAATQNRRDEVGYVTSDGAWDAEHNFPITRQLRSLVENRSPAAGLPQLFVQSCADDAGVHNEQVLPFADAWRRRGGRVDLDVRPFGGHTSDHATRPLLLDAITALLRGDSPDTERYRTDPVFAGTIVAPPISHRLRRRLHPLRERLRRRHSRAKD